MAQLLARLSILFHNEPEQTVLPRCLRFPGLTLTLLVFDLWQLGLHDSQAEHPLMLLETASRSFLAAVLIVPRWLFWVLFQPQD